MSWTAIVPINYGREGKTRLAARLSPEQRARIAENMTRHVLQELSGVRDIASVRVLSALRPHFVSDQWIADQGRGLNAEIAAARGLFANEPVLFIHADLPFLQAEDVQALLDAAAHSGAAIAPDRHGLGTNALALADGRPFSPAFGANSFSRHKALLPDAAIVERTGLSFDLDEPEDLDLARARGLVIPPG